MEEREKRIYPKGIICFAPREGAKSWEVGDMIISFKQLSQWIEENPDSVSHYKGEPQLRLKLSKGQDGRPSVCIDTFKPKKKEASPEGEEAVSELKDRDGIVTDAGDDLPF